MKALFDTNILIDHLNGIEEAATEIQRYDSPAISIVTWIEVLSGAKENDILPMRRFLSDFDLFDVNSAVAERAVELRKKYRLRTSDAIIWASAQAHSMLFVTRDEKDFRAREPGVRIPYRLAPTRN